jgi:hypothetical protein
LTDRNGNEIASWKKPYHLFTRGNPQWRMLPVTPAAVPGKFSICFNFNPTATKGVYVHLDNSTKGHSADGLPGRKPRKRDDGDWMIRVVVRKAKTPAP